MGIIMTPLRLRNAIAGGDFIEVEGKVDTGATMLVLPGEIASQLGLQTIRKQLVECANQSTEEKDVLWGVELEIAAEGRILRDRGTQEEGPHWSGQADGRTGFRS